MKRERAARGGTRTAGTCGVVALAAALAAPPLAGRAQEAPPPGAVDISFRHLVKGPVFGHYRAGTPIVAEYDSSQFPESAYFDPTSGDLLVSNIHGLGMARDGNGWIGRARPGSPGSELRPWARGLDGPKGMRAHAGTLWVADIDKLVAIALDSGEIRRRVPVPGARFLNDVAVDPAGRIYVSDTFADTIYRVVADKAEIFAQGPHLEGPNGLLVDGDRLVVAALGPTGPDFRTAHPGRLLALDLASGAETPITPPRFGNLDGVERFDADRYLVSDWPAGKVYLVARDGKAETVVEGILGAADIGFDPGRSWVAIPRMGEDRVSVVSLAVQARLGPAAPEVPAAWEQGRQLSKSCTACHGRVDVPEWPRLGGQGKAFLAKALRDFRAGARSDPLMTPQAQSLADSDIMALATYYSSWPSPGADPAAAGPKPTPERLASCAACHGSAGKSANPLWPHLAGQKRGYLAKAMRDFRQGARKDPVMGAMAASLSDDDIAALAAHFAALGKK